MEFHRSPQQTLWATAALGVVAVMTLVVVTAAFVSGKPLYASLGVAGVVWTALLAVNLVWGGVVMRLHRHGITLYGAFGARQFYFDDLVWAQMEPGDPMCVFAYSSPDAGTVRTASIAQRRIGAQGVTLIRDYLARARPDLAAPTDRTPSSHDPSHPAAVAQT